MQVLDLNTPNPELPRLRDRELDLVIARLIKRPTDDEFCDNLNIEIVYNDQLVVAAGMHTAWARRRRVDLAELVDELWIMTPPDSSHHLLLMEAFKSARVSMPKTALTTFSDHLRAHLVSSGPFIAAFPRSGLKLKANHFP